MNQKNGYYPNEKSNEGADPGKRARKPSRRLQDTMGGSDTDYKPDDDDDENPQPKKRQRKTPAKKDVVKGPADKTKRGAAQVDGVDEGSAVSLALQVGRTQPSNAAGWHHVDLSYHP